MSDATNRLTPAKEAELKRLAYQAEEWHRHEIWLTGLDGYADVVERASIESITLVGEYDYRAFYDVAFVGGSVRRYEIHYHAIREAAVEYGNPWAVAILPSLEPLQCAVCEAWAKGVHPRDNTSSSMTSS